MPPLSHIVYIPGLFVLAFWIGWTLAQRSVRAEWDRAEKRRREAEENA